MARKKQENLKHIETQAYTEAEAAKYIGMSRSYLRQARMSGSLHSRATPPKHLKVGKKTVRYLKDDLDEWLVSWQ